MPDRFFNKYLGHNEGVKMLQQLLDITNLEADSMKLEVFKNLDNISSIMSDMGADPLKIRRLVKDVFKTKDPDHMDSSDPINTVDGWDQGPQMFSDYIGESMINLLASEINKVRDIKLGKALGTDAFYSKINGKWQYLQPFLPDDVKRAQKVYTKGKVKKLKDWLTESDTFKELPIKRQVQYEIAIDSYFAWRPGTVVLGKSMIDSVPIQTRTRQMAKLQPFKNARQAWSHLIYNMKANIAEGLPLMHGLDDLELSSVRVPVGGADETPTLRVIGISDEHIDSIIHPEDVGKVQGDYDGDKVALIAWSDPEMYSAIEKQQGKFDANKIIYYVMDADDKTLTELIEKELEDNRTRPLTDAEQASIKMRYAQQQVGFVSNARMKQSQFRFLQDKMEQEGKSFIEQITENDVTYQLRAVPKNESGYVYTKKSENGEPIAEWVEDIYSAKINMMGSSTTDSAKSGGFPNADFVNIRANDLAYHVYEIKKGDDGKIKEKRVKPEDGLDNYKNVVSSFKVIKMANLANNIKRCICWRVD